MSKHRNVLLSAYRPDQVWHRSSFFFEMTVERTGHVHRATVNPLVNRSLSRLLGLRCLRGGPAFCAKPPPVWSAWGAGSVLGEGNTAGRRQQLLEVRRPECKGDARASRRASSVPRVRRVRTGSVVSPKLGVVFHYFAHQLFDQLLADQAILARGQFRDRLCDRDNHFIRFVGVNFV